MNIGRPDANEYAAYYDTYVKLIPDNCLDHLKHQLQVFNSWRKTVPFARFEHRYQEGKWSLKEVLIHINDTERVFAYRAMSFARKENQALPGFDQDSYMDSSDFMHVSPDLVLNEFESIRSSSLGLFSSFSTEQWHGHGQASGNNVSVRALAFIIAGHFKHHMNIIKERYM